MGPVSIARLLASGGRPSSGAATPERPRRSDLWPALRPSYNAAPEDSTIQILSPADNAATARAHPHGKCRLRAAEMHCQTGFYSNFHDNFVICVSPANLWKPPNLLAAPMPAAFPGRNRHPVENADVQVRDVHAQTRGDHALFGMNRPVPPGQENSPAIDRWG